jgi:hypothetical protein
VISERPQIAGARHDDARSIRYLVFSTGRSALRLSGLVKHNIDVGDGKPVTLCRIKSRSSVDNCRDEAHPSVYRLRFTAARNRSHNGFNSGLYP